jgi:hypothetical protein
VKTLSVNNFNQRRQHANAWAQADARRPDATLCITPMKQLGDFKARRRKNDAGFMHRIAESMSNADTGNAGNWFADMCQHPF